MLHFYISFCWSDTTLGRLQAENNGIGEIKYEVSFQKYINVNVNTGRLYNKNSIDREVSLP